VALGLAEERRSESVVQVVGLAIEELVHEEAALCLVGRGQVEPGVAEAGAELGQGWLQRMALPVAAQGQLVRAVGPGQQDAAGLDAPAEVKQKPDGGHVGPLQVVEYEE
jgi:hypothetical protein